MYTYKQSTCLLEGVQLSCHIDFLTVDCKSILYLVTTVNRRPYFTQYL